jgi:hypothetical protein
MTLYNFTVECRSLDYADECEGQVSIGFFSIVSFILETQGGEIRSIIKRSLEL